MSSPVNDVNRDLSNPLTGVRKKPDPEKSEPEKGNSITTDPVAKNNSEDLKYSLPGQVAATNSDIGDIRRAKLEDLEKLNLPEYKKYGGAYNITNDFYIAKAGNKEFAIFKGTNGKSGFCANKSESETGWLTSSAAMKKAVAEFESKNSNKVTKAKNQTIDEFGANSKDASFYSGDGDQNQLWIDKKNGQDLVAYKHTDGTIKRYQMPQQFNEAIKQWNDKGPGDGYVELPPPPDSAAVEKTNNSEKSRGEELKERGLAGPSSLEKTGTRSDTKEKTIDELLNESVMSLNSSKINNSEYIAGMKDSIKKRFPEEVIRDLLSSKEAGGHGLRIVAVNPGEPLDQSLVDSFYLGKPKALDRDIDGLKKYKDGFYYPRAQEETNPFLVVKKQIGSVDHNVLAHELGHAIDNRILEKLKADNHLVETFVEEGLLTQFGLLHAENSFYFSSSSSHLLERHRASVMAASQYRDVLNSQIKEAYSKTDRKLKGDPEIEKTLEYYINGKTKYNPTSVEISEPGTKESFAQAISSLVANVKENNGRITDYTDELVFDVVFGQRDGFNDRVKTALELVYPSFRGYLSHDINFSRESTD